MKKTLAAAALAGLVALGASACGGGPSVSTAGLQKAGVLYLGCTVEHNNTEVTGLGLRIANPTGKPVTVTGISVDIVVAGQLLEQPKLLVDGNSVQPGNTALHFQLSGDGYTQSKCRVAGWS
jgi:hypothetical protein